jgi:hypothetical protein
MRATIVALGLLVLSSSVSHALAVNVGDYGAKCDGVTDDSASFSAAKAAAGLNGSVHVGGNGICVAKITLDVAGQIWTIAKGTTLLHEPATTGYMVEVKADHVTLTGGGTLDGNGASVGPACNGGPLACGALHAAFVSYLTMDGLVIQNSSGRNIYAENTPYLTIKNCQGYGAGFHSFVVQITAPPLDHSDNIPGVQIINNLVDTTGSPNQDKDSYQVMGLYLSGRRYFFDGLVFTGNTSKLGTKGLGDRVEFAELRNSSLAQNVTTNGRFALSINSSVNISVTGNTATGISETCFEEVGNDGAVWKGNTCSNGSGRVLGGGFWVQEGISSKNLVVQGLTGKNMGGGGIALYYAQNATISGVNLEAQNGGYSKQQCVFLAWSTGISVDNLECDGTTSSGSNYGVIAYNSQNIAVTGSRFKSLLGSALQIAGDAKGPGAGPIIAATNYGYGGTLPSGTTYFARVVAICPSGSTVGNESTATTPTGSNNAALIWAWAPVSCATSYQLWVGTSPGAENTYFNTDSHYYMQTVPAGIQGNIPTKTPSNSSLANITIGSSQTTSVKSLISASYSGGPAAGTQHQ